MQLLAVGYAISGTFTLCSIVVSGWQIWTHLIYNPTNEIRKLIIRILLMVPIYALTSWLALVWNQQELLFETVRDCYEAFVLYSFYMFLVAYLGGKNVLANTLRSKSQVQHSVPCCCLVPWTMGGKFLQRSMFGILQYIPIKVMTSIVTLIASSFQKYGEGQFFNPYVAYPYVCFIMNCSQGWALYCLVLFFLGTKEELAPVKPLPKFLAIKAIIFFTYWQSIIISILQVMNVINEGWEIGCSPTCWDSKKIASALNDFVICVEMVMFSIAHHYVFSITDFLPEERSKYGTHGPRRNNAKAPLLANFMDAINVTDVSKDLKNSRQSILTRKQELAAKYDELANSPPI